ncbi:butyrate kinase [Geosporobacter ferrireducens]|uniref:Probable butyrate kinase n=1 Tax=Geosporobacter ferrireducens TaxID=1424294 RepID=A0A1D8GKF2_9FIRM|nr:butyrate kinase [Geosporobacter ferrireducens]AOT71396.1 butyrate kinase [Geosporobacter ferrireducens]MTI57699.1 butyrate kinase [Geosporobacter ferrireducens]
MAREYTLVINPGSTSTKVAVFKGDENVIQKNLSHSPEEVDKFQKITDQYEYRRDIILDWFRTEGFEPAQLQAVVGRGGLLKPMPSGTYIVTDTMIEDLKIGIQGEHASNLGGIIAKSIADAAGIKAYIVDPVAVDEFDDIAGISGMPEINRRSLLHALNIKAVAYRVAKEMKKEVNELNLIMAHLGGGISIVPLRNGKMVDANNANEMGPLSPERSGGLPVGDLAKLCFSGKYTLAEIKKKITGKGGLVAYLGTNDAREVEEKINNGNKQAKLVYDAMGYQIAKEIGAMATVLEGKVDAIVLTGGIAYSKMLTAYIEERVSFIAPVIVKPGEDEMLALNEGVNRVLSGRETAKIYEEEVK